MTKREDLRLQGDTGSKTGGYQSEKGNKKRAHRDTTRISRMLGTTAFSARTEFSVTTGPMFANGASNPANLNNVLNREILPVLNRCGICRKSKLSHDAGVSHEYVRDGSLPTWHGFHGFRRGLASTLYSLGVDDLMIQQILRHQDVSVTRKHYIKTVPEQSVSAMAKLEAALCADRALATAPVKNTMPN
jgi:integrase